MKGWEIVASCTVLVDSDDSLMFQTDSSWISGLQSTAMGVPWIPVVTSGEPESEVYELLQGLDDGVRRGLVEEWSCNPAAPPAWAARTPRGHAASRSRAG